MSDAASYAVVMTGEITEGESLVDVKHNVAMLFNVVGPKLDKMFTGKPVAIRRNIDRHQADELCTVLLEAGVIAKVKSEKSQSESDITEQEAQDTAEKVSATVVDMQSGQVVSEPTVSDQRISAPQQMAEPASSVALTLGLQDMACPHCGGGVKLGLQKVEQNTVARAAPETVAEPAEQSVAETAQAPVGTADLSANSDEATADLFADEEVIQEAADFFAEEAVSEIAEPAPVVEEAVSAPVVEEVVAEVAESAPVVERVVSEVAEPAPAVEEVVSEVAEEAVAEAVEPVPVVDEIVEEAVVEVAEPVLVEEEEMISEAVESVAAEEMASEDLVLDDEPVAFEEPEATVEEILEAVSEAVVEEPVRQQFEEVAEQPIEEMEVVGEEPQPVAATIKPVAEVAQSSQVAAWNIEGYEPDLQCPRCAHEQAYAHECGLCKMDLRLHIRRLHRKEFLRERRREMKAQANA